MQTDDTRILGMKGLIPPVIMHDEMQADERAMDPIIGAREAVTNCLHDRDDRLMVVVGPCSVHDKEAVLEYADKLNELRLSLKDDLCIVMRVYFEKPRTTVGWKGFVNDPDLDGSFNINKGLRLARELLLTINNKGLACGTEFLDVISPQYLADLIAWGAIGARTTESQVHRELASGLSAPIGFKNATNGDVQVAVDAIRAAQGSHHFLSVTKQGNTAIFKTAGNADAHLILRGGNTGTNYDAQSIDDVCEVLAKYNLPQKVMVDCSHGNSRKDHKRQPDVVADIASQVSNGSKKIFGVMIESHLKEGNQSIDSDPLEYGKSITDACVSWETTEVLLESLAEAVRQRRQK